MNPLGSRTQARGAASVTPGGPATPAAASCARTLFSPTPDDDPALRPPLSSGPRRSETFVSDVQRLEALDDGGIWIPNQGLGDEHHDAV